MTDDTPRLIERAFPLKQASLDSVHEKNVRHGHISTLHIWPARRPLAACRAALIATLLPDPGTPEGRQALCEKIGGRVVEKTEGKKMPNGRTVERIHEETVGGILHWKRETENAEDLAWFRQEIRKAHGGRAPRVLDPFAGGGAIPLEAMRLGCEVTAADINPVAWFILKCTLEYPQKLAGKTHPLPEFILKDQEFMRAFHKAHPSLGDFQGKTTTKKGGTQPSLFGMDAIVPEADLAWHVRAWGRWILAEARKTLGAYYPTYADFEPAGDKNPQPYEKREMQMVGLHPDGTANLDALNAEFSKDDLKNPNIPRWVAKPTVAYLWARTVPCKNCRALVPLLKTRWLCKKPNKRVLLTMEPNADQSGVVFGVQKGVPQKGDNAAQNREHDKQLGEGTMSRAGAKCPCCGAIQTMADIRLEGKDGNLGAINTVVVVEGRKGKEYRLPTEYEVERVEAAQSAVQSVFKSIPFGVPEEPTPKGGSGASRAFSVDGYGFDQWGKLFNHRQLLMMGQFTQAQRVILTGKKDAHYDDDWSLAISSYLAACLSRLADRGSTVCSWIMNRDLIRNTFARFALPITWDFAELNPFSGSSGGYAQAVDWVAEVVEHLLEAEKESPSPTCLKKSALVSDIQGVDLILTDPPYYDAIPYSDLMDFFYVWLRRSLAGVSSELDAAFAEPLAPKWSQEKQDGEVIDDSSRFGGDKRVSKKNYEDGMARAFRCCCDALKPDGRLVVVFAHKHPDAWETLVTATIQAGFVVDGSWPIQTERLSRTRAMSSAALASSVWMVCKKRPPTAKAGWDNRVLESMREKIRIRLREFWDAGIRGPDFVWAATGPALEAYSRHPVVKKANDPGEIMAVGEFLSHVRRMVVDFVVGRVMTGGQEDAAADRMDAPTSYYLLHRHDFGMEDAPSGACILYATACGLSDRELDSGWQLLAHTGGNNSSDDEDQEKNDPDADEEDEDASGSGSKIRLRTWQQRKHPSMGFNAPGGQPVPFIDRVHRLMHLWKGGDVIKVDDYLDDNGLRRQELFRRLLQSLIELSPQGSEERALLESLSNHVGALGAVDDRQLTLSKKMQEGI